MACVYTYKGFTFNSELELDNFLLEKEKYYDKYKDLVFSSTNQQMEVANQLDEVRKKAEEDNHLYDLYRQAKRERRLTYGEDGDIDYDMPPYIGVNRFLASIETERLFPEFRKESYWNNRFEAWTNGEYSETELEVFGYTVETAPKITNKDIQKDMRKKIEFKWENQAKIGTAIHNVMQLYFTKDGDQYVYEKPDASQWIKDHLEAENIPYLTDAAIIQSIEHAKNLHNDLKSRFGDELMFFPEFMVSGEATHPDNGANQTLIGIIDLLVVDKKGKVHILDYKTSIKNYSDFDSSKKAAYKYQMATYQRILQKHGINTFGGKLMVAPIKISNFRLNGDSYIYDGIETADATIELNNSITVDNWNRIENFMPVPFNITVTSEELHTEVSRIMAEWFPDYASIREVKREDIIEMLKRYDLLKPNDSGEYIYKPYNTKDDPIIATSESVFIDKVLEYRQNLIPRRLRTTQDIKSQLQEAIEKGVDNVDWVKQKLGRNGESVSWLQDNLSKYCNEYWEIADNNTLEAYGVLMLKNKYTHQVDFVRVSTDMLHYNYRKKFDKKDPKRNRLGLTGNFEADVVEQSKSDSLMLEAVNGNIELMETLVAINQLEGLEGDVVVGEVKIINPYDSQSMLVSNEELQYCWNSLNRHSSVSNDKIGTGDIKFANKFRLVTNQFRDIMNKAAEAEYKDGYQVYRQLETSRDMLQRAIDGSVQDKIDQLQKLLQTLQKDHRINQVLQKTYTDSKSLSDDTISLYNAILTTIAQLKGINFRQQIKDHSQWLEKAMILKHGWSGTYLDNPGNLDSETLNLVTKLVTEAYQNTRDDMQRRKAVIQEKVNKFKKAKGATAAALNIGMNQVDLYKNLFEEVKTEEGTDLMFKNLRSVSDLAEHEFLEFVLDEINRNRFPLKADSELEAMKNSYDTEYYRVPLAKGGTDSQVSSRGLLTMFRDRLKSWNPKVAFQRARDKVEGIYNSDEDLKEQQSAEVLYQMSNMFDESEISTERRLRKISNLGIHYFERNLETLLLKHDFAYIQKKNVDKVFPLIKAATIHLGEQGAAQNTKFNNDLKYVSEYIRNKIKNQSIINPDFKGAIQIANNLKRAASMFTLAFSPVQALYQPLQGLWQDISLMIRKPDGKDSFTFKHFKKAFSMVAQDFTHFSDKPTLCSLINELYAINDMDMNTYAERLSKGKKGIWNMENLAFKFASRPDYYNRMSIFLSQMMGDGCLDAHKLENGKLKYDWKLDKRFEAFANGRTSDPKYNEQKSLYYAIAQQFVNEHATYEEDGNIVEFTIDMNNPKPLPRAYTNKQAEGMKSLADDIYGYYSHEKKSLVMSCSLGSMWLQFKTFWSGKKNQYLQSGSVRMRGKWEQKTEKDKDGNEIKYYYQVDSTGAIKYDEPLTTTETIAPAMVWKGQWQEGILVTLGDIAYKTIQDPRHFIEHFNEKWNNSDENLKTCYRSNMKQFLYDTLMFFIFGSIIGGLLGDWLEEMKEENKDNTDLMEGMKLAAANIAVSSVKNSFLDLNFIDSIGSPIGSWTPFALEWAGRQFNNVAKVATGDEDIWDGALKIASANKQIKPIFDAIKPEMFRNKREGGTWESATARKNREKRENA